MLVIGWMHGSRNCCQTDKKQDIRFQEKVFFHSIVPKHDFTGWNLAVGKFSNFLVKYYENKQKV